MRVNWFFVFATASIVAMPVYCQVPRTWVDAEIARHEIPLSDPVASPKHVSADYYYRIPVRPIYKGYPVYAPGHEPSGYMDWLKQQEPVIIWDHRGHAPPLKTDADWIRAGQIVFDAPKGPIAFFGIADARNPDWYRKTGAPVAMDGTLPEVQYVVREKGTVELGAIACAGCHTRVMSDGSVLRGAQSNFPVQRAVAYSMRASAAAAKDKDQFLAQTRVGLKSLHASPWMHRGDAGAQERDRSTDRNRLRTGGNQGNQETIPGLDGSRAEARCHQDSRTRSICTLASSDFVFDRVAEDGRCGGMTFILSVCADGQVAQDLPWRIPDQPQ